MRDETPRDVVVGNGRTSLPLRWYGQEGADHRPGTPWVAGEGAHGLDALFGRLAPARTAGFDAAVQVDARGLVLRAHPALLESALRNLVDNALRYGASQVAVDATATDTGVQIAVRDDGAGVSDADRARLTERFFRVLGTRQTGSGLGLSIVARIVAQHGTSLRFEPGMAERGLGVVMDLRAIAAGSPAPWHVK